MDAELTYDIGCNIGADLVNDDFQDFSSFECQDLVIQAMVEELGVYDYYV